MYLSHHFLVFGICLTNAASWAPSSACVWALVRRKHENILILSLLYYTLGGPQPKRVRLTHVSTKNRLCFFAFTDNYVYPEEILTVSARFNWY